MTILNKSSRILPLLVMIAIVSAFLLSSSKDKEKNEIMYPAENSGCLTSGCHAGIEPIRQHDSKMAQAIYKKGMEKGDPNGCVVCHFGDPKQVKSKDLAHSGLIKHPGSIWVVDKTCEQCHQGYKYTMERNLMMTEAGKIQGALWGWGARTGYDRIYGNYDVKDTDGPVPMRGTGVYKDYMTALAKENPHSFPMGLKKLPEVNMDSLAHKPWEAVYTYIRTDCQRCHIGVQGAQRRGDYRGVGCASCHIPYSDEGYYEGDDESISNDKPGHLLVHSIQSSRKAKVKVNDVTYSGIPSETCTSCHNRGKRIGVSYLGMVESEYNTPYTPTPDGGQPRLHGKRYQFIKDDAHHSMESRPGNPKGGLLCQDCHTSISVHGNGNIGGSNFGEVEVECADCHGTPKQYPWELPIGFGDEFGIKTSDKARGVTFELLDIQQKYSTVYPPRDGYLLTARGNPLGNVVKEDNDVIMHSASGLDFNVPVLKILKLKEGWQNPRKAITAMIGVENHMDKLECYACHSSWTPQCYGCHVKVDFSEGKKAFDWVKAGNRHDSCGRSADMNPDDKKNSYTDGKHTESRSFVRWEEPILGVNGEGRVSPIMTGCQQITTVIGKDGEALVSNKIWRTPGGVENSDDQGQRCIDMTPAQPHTVTARARSCVSCHANPKALGYGIGDSLFMNGYQEDRYMDMQTADGQIISKNSKPQFTAIPDLPFDLSQVVTRDGKQLTTVGHHWPLSGPLAQDQRERMERVGVCISCHQDIPDGNLSMLAITSAGEMLGMVPHSDKEHSDLLNSDINWAATTRLLAPILGGSMLLMIIYIIYLRRKARKK
jgi:decaheme cytochrome c component MtrC/MtrF-like protein